MNESLTSIRQQVHRVRYLIRTVFAREVSSQIHIATRFAERIQHDLRDRIFLKAIDHILFALNLVIIRIAL